MVDIDTILNLLDPVEMTVRAQVYSPYNDPEVNHWTRFGQERPVKTTRLSEIGEVDFRPVATRRPWDGHGIEIPVRTGPIKSGDMVPIESWWGIGEKDIQRAMEGAGGNAEIAMRVMMADIPGRNRRLVKANWGKIDVDFFKAWFYGYVDVDDPDNGSYQMSYGISGSRITAAASSLAAASNAFDMAIDMVRNAETLGLMPRGILASSDRINEIIKDMPTTGIYTPRRPTMADAEAWFQDEFGTDFNFIKGDWTLDVPNVSTGAFTSTRLFPVDRLAIIPTGPVGEVIKAPVYRAQDLAASLPDARIEQDGVVLTPEAVNNGKGLKTTAQLNAMAWPNENKVLVYTGV